jgi:hypothetical protein
MVNSNMCFIQMECQSICFLFTMLSNKDIKFKTCLDKYVLKDINNGLYTFLLVLEINIQAIHNFFMIFLHLQIVSSMAWLLTLIIKVNYGMSN